MKMCDKIVSVKELSRVFKRMYGSGNEFKHLQNAIDQTPESGIKEEFLQCVMDKGIACWAITHAEGLQCDLCKNQHKWDEWCDRADGDCNKCKADCICRACDGKTHFIFFPEKAHKMRNRMEEMKNDERY